MCKPVTGYGGIGVHKCLDQRELDAAVRAEPGPELLVEEFLPGPQINVGGVALHGEVVVAASYRPVSAAGDQFGPSVAIEVVEPSEPMDLALQVVAGLGYTGPFCLDTVMADNGPRIVDFNARVFGPWAGLQRAGLDILGAYLFTLGLAGRPGPGLPRPGARVVVDMDPATSVRSSMQFLAGTRSLVGLGGLLGQGSQLAAKRVHS